MKSPFIRRTTGIKNSLEWKIILLILLGPVLTLIVNVYKVLHIRFETADEWIDCRIFISQRVGKTLAVGSHSGFGLLVPFAYRHLKNCNSHKKTTA